MWEVFAVRDEEICAGLPRVAGRRVERVRVSEVVLLGCAIGAWSGVCDVSLFVLVCDRGVVVVVISWLSWLLLFWRWVSQLLQLGLSSFSIGIWRRWRKLPANATRAQAQAGQAQLVLPANNWEGGHQRRPWDPRTAPNAGSASPMRGSVNNGPGVGWGNRSQPPISASIAIATAASGAAVECRVRGFHEHLLPLLGCRCWGCNLDLVVSS